MKPDPRSAEDQAARPRGGPSGRFCKKHQPEVEKRWELAKGRFLGAQAICPECSKSSREKYYKEHREECLATTARWARKNPEKRRASYEKWKANNPERCKEEKIRWAKENPEKRRISRKKWVVKNPEKVRAYNAKAKKNNPENKRRSEAKRRAILSAAIIPDEPFDQYGKHEGKECYVCGAAAQQTDHVRPVRQKGAHANFNFAPICGSCNAAKGDRVWPGQPGWNEFVMKRQQRKAS